LGVDTGVSILYTDKNAITLEYLIQRMNTQAGALQQYKHNCESNLNKQSFFILLDRGLIERAKYVRA